MKSVKHTLAPIAELHSLLLFINFYEINIKESLIRKKYIAFIYFHKNPLTVLIKENSVA